MVTFVASSLDSLMNNLVKDGCKLSGFENYSDEQYQLLIRKGVYPYEYMLNWNKIELPPKEAFHSNLNMNNISDKDYSLTQKVWKGFDMKDSGKYHDLYLKTDIILLSKVFKAFRSTCLKHNSFDPTQFYTSPGLAWQACLKMRGIELELLTDPDMLLMFEHGNGGGITQAVHRYAEENNKYMGDKFNPKKDSSYLQYLIGQ